jgi:hypothetical protein
MNKYFAVLGFCLLTLVVDAQRYDFVAGLKFSDGIALSGAYRFADEVTGEVLLKPDIFSDYSMASIMAKRHFSILGSRRFNAFAGGGLFTLSDDIADKLSANASGIGFTLGMEMTIGRINVSTDYMPLFTVNQNDLNRNYYSNSGISVRYVFDKRESKTRSKFEDFKDRFKRKKKK